MSTGESKNPSTLPARDVDGFRRKLLTRKRHQDGMLLKLKHGWACRFYEQGDRQRKRVQKFLGSFKKLTKPQAKKAMREVLAVVNENVASPPETETTTFREYADRWIEDCETREKKPIKDSVSRDWRSILKNHLHGPIGDLPLSDVGNRTMKSLVERLSRKKLAPATIRNICLVVKLVKSSALDDDGNQLFPERWNSRFIDAPTVDPTKQRRPTFTAEQISGIVKAATGRLQMAAILFAATGLRAGELLGLELRHFDGTSITIDQAVWGPGQVQGPKTRNAYRTVDLHPSVSALLKQFIGDRTSGFIFRASGGRPLTQANFLRRELHPLLASLEIPMRGFHSFRRFRNTFLRQSHCPDGILKFWLGHAGRDMSDTYDRSREDVQYRQDVAKTMGIGFELPIALSTKQKREKSSQSDVFSLIGRQAETAVSG
jgi:integrase